MELGADSLFKKGFDLAFDEKEMLLHKIDCEDLKSTPTERLSGYLMATMPRKVKFCPCPKCFPYASQEYKERTTGLKGRHMVRVMMGRNEDKPYVHDQGLGCVHRLHSPCTYARPIRFLTPIATIPDDMPLCEQCFSRFSEEAIARRMQTEFQNVQAEGKGESLVDAISRICSSYNMYVEFVSKTAYITTAAGQWHFDMQQQPFELYHANYVNSEEGKDSLRYFRGETGYHKQEGNFESIQDVLRYIVFHDDAMVRRMVVQKQEPIRTIDELKDIIVARMEEKNLWDDTVSNALNISDQAWLHYFEDGLGSMPLYLIEKLAMVIGVNVDFLFSAISSIAEWRCV